MAPPRQFCITKSGWYTASKDKVGEKLKEAVQVYKEAEGSLSILEIARLYAVSKTTLYYRIKKHQDQLSYAVLKGKLTPEEEESIQNWILEYQSWRVPTRVAKYEK